MFKAKGRDIISSETGEIYATVVPGVCNSKAAREMAAYAAQQMNHSLRRELLRQQQRALGGGHGD